MRERFYLATIADDAPDVAQAHGLGLELDEFCTTTNLDADFPRWDAVVRNRMAKSHRFILHAPYAELYPCAIDPLVRNVARHRFAQAAHAALGYGVKRMVVHSGFIPKIYFPGWYIEQASAFFRDFLSTLPADFQLLIENVLDPDPRPLLDLAHAIGDPRAKLCLDVGHANVASDIPVREWLRALAPELAHLHVHDNDGSWDWHRIPGEGTIGFPGLFGDILAAAPGATITFECTDAAGCVRRLISDGIL